MIFGNVLKIRIHDVTMKQEWVIFHPERNSGSSRHMDLLMKTKKEDPK